MKIIRKRKELDSGRNEEKGEKEREGDGGTKRGKKGPNKGGKVRKCMREREKKVKES